MINNVKKYQWLERRLTELGKKNYELADYLGIQHDMIMQNRQRYRKAASKMRGDWNGKCL